MKNNLKEFYDKRVKVYDAVLTTGSLYEIIYNFIGEKEKVLDVGCANGNFSGQLKKKKAKVTGIEVSPILIGDSESD